MRVLWISDSPTTPSGFGAVTREVCGRLARRGHRFEILGWQTHGATTRWLGMPVHPVRHDMFGADVVLGYLMRSRPEFLITLADVWWLSFLADPPVQKYLDQSGCRWILYSPIDGADRDGRLPDGWIRMLEAADLPVAMSRFGANVTEACGIVAEYVPHGCDLELFRPPADKHAAKARFGYEDRFVVLSDARNQPRKLLPRLLDVFADFARERPDALLHLHTDPYDDASNSELYSYRLLDDIALAGLGDRVRFTQDFRMRASGGVPLEQLAAIYQAADVHVLSSWGEGFGLPNLQAAAAGVVPIAVAHAASRELADGHGFAVPVETTVIDEFGLERALLDRGAVVEALAWLYDDRDELAERSRRSREFALAYDWERIVDDWEHLLAHVPPRRGPARLSMFSLVAGDDEPPRSDLPAPVVSTISDAFASLADGTKLEIKVTERRYGEVASEIRREAFREGDELSVPVRLSAAFEHAPRPRVGNIMIGPASLPLALALKQIFPMLAFQVPRPGGDPESDHVPAIQDLLPALAHCALVIDFARDAAPALDLACAALGIPYAGASPLWPAVPGDSAIAQARRLLTDQGMSEWRRERALQHAERDHGALVIEMMRGLALVGQPQRRVGPEAVVGGVA